MKEDRELFPSLETRRFFTVKEAAQVLGISVPGIHIWIQKGRIRRPVRVSAKGGYRIPREEIIRLLRSAGREVPGVWLAKRTRVLVIDDDPRLRELVADGCQTSGFLAEVRTASTPEDGLLLAIPFAPDVILLDQFEPMVGLTSTQALVILRRAEALRGVKIIGCWRKGPAAARHPTPNVFLPKPFGLSELREAIMGPDHKTPSRAEIGRRVTPDRRRWEYKVKSRQNSR